MVMNFLFDNFADWLKVCEQNNCQLFEPVLQYEMQQKGRSEEEIWTGLDHAYAVMKDAVQTGLSEDMKSYSGMINNGAKKVAEFPVSVLSKEFQQLISRALAAKEVNSCMGRVVAAPTAGASGILPGTMVTLQEIHKLVDRKILEGLLKNTKTKLPLLQKHPQKKKKLPLLKLKLHLLHKPLLRHNLL